jgi:hypothetical protein
VRIIRWVGHPSPLYDPNILRRITAGKLDPVMVLGFEMFEHQRKISVNKGRSTFRVVPQQGFSKPYQWVPQYFDVEMEERDVARLLKNPLERYMFLDVTDGVPLHRPLLKVSEWRELMEAVRIYPAPEAMVAAGFWTR